MNWGSDELHHRSGERTGWCAELRAATPEDVDETVTGAVEYATATTPLPDDPDTPDADALDADSLDAADRDDSADPEDAACESSADSEDEANRDDQPDGYVCALCGGDIPDGEALDAEGARVDVGFEWADDVEAYHPSCIESGEGRFLPWAANGVLQDETTG